MLDNKNIKLIRPLKWEEVFLFWYENEGDKKNWIEIAKDRGFKSWADWRLTNYALPFECHKAEWGLYEVVNPSEVIPELYGGPFRSWAEKHYNGKNSMTFKELAGLPEVVNHSAVQRMKNDFPVDKTITCLEVNGKIYVIEGMHRCCTLAVMAKENIDLPNNLRFVIGKSSMKELSAVGSAK